MPPRSAPGSLAERGSRLLAATLDELILLAVSLPMIIGAMPAMVALVGGAVGGEADVESLDTMSVLRAMVGGPGTSITVLALIAWCIITAWLVATNGQSIGKRLVGIKVVRTDGSRASFARIFLLRNVVNGLPNLLPYVGWLYQLIDPLLIYQESRQCLHDRIADTIVVRA
ncbi:MAG TPA: RDD family protein [Steroidobacteraceae bacterium]|nr:RDD family protein [Steroidobacteraceae bacterium]